MAILFSLKKIPLKFQVGGSVLLLSAAGIAVYAFATVPNTPTVAEPTQQPSATAIEATVDLPALPEEVYKGEDAMVGSVFSVNVPNGWSASVSKSSAFLAVMFARPNQLSGLTYSVESTPVIDYSGIPSWGGLTEHFFVIAPVASSQFKASDHLNVTSEPFTFDDGTIGTKYYVVKNAAEAQKWGGLQKDTEWQGRTYIYEKGGKRIEAHLALYPSTTIDIPFYESVVKSVKVQ